ncbi:MAG: hypothetical protein FWF87_06965, partial [Synergistaceae bacterium]|nr:hypothetical protein [Synergistaceae bacterium]
LMHERMPIPNLSMMHTANQFAAYVLGDPKSRICAKCENMCTECPFQNPIAILTSQSNLRLRMQAGTFLAFSLYRNTKFGISSLESLQDEWLGKYGKEPFLYKITLNTKDALEQIADWTLSAGMSTFRTYPELENIGTSIS